MKSAKSNNPGKSVIQTKYDIVTKGHEGELKFESAPMKGSIFVITLPAITSM